MKICVAQLKSVKGEVQENIKHHVHFIERAIELNGDFIVFPELSITGYEPSIAKKLATSLDDPIFDQFQNLSDEHQITIGIGMPLSAANGINISMLIFQENEERSSYSKQLLHAEELAYFVRAMDQAYLTLNNTKIALGICFETLQREHFLNAVEQNADIYIASAAKSQTGMERALTYFPEIANEFSTPILISNAVGKCDNFKSFGQSSAWNRNGELLNQLDTQNEGIIMFDTDSNSSEIHTIEITTMPSPLVSSEWLNENRQIENLVILDASPAKTVSGKQSEFENDVIPNARYFDLKNMFSDPNGKFPNTFPSLEQFEKACQSLGINNSSKIIVYDNLGIYTSPRVWWMFKTMGHENIAILNGGLPDWVEKGYETNSLHDSAFSNGNFTAKFNPIQIVNIDFVASNIESQAHLVIDARSDGRFNGTSKEPRPGLRSGHIPKSVNVPFVSVLEAGKFKSKPELEELFASIRVDHRPITFSCGSGITACIVLLAAELVLKNETSVYDGSWTEWATLK